MKIYLRPACDFETRRGRRTVVVLYSLVLVPIFFVIVVLEEIYKAIKNTLTALSDLASSISQVWKQ